MLPAGLWLRPAGPGFRLSGPGRFQSGHSRLQSAGGSPAAVHSVGRAPRPAGPGRHQFPFLRWQAGLLHPPARPGLSPVLARHPPVRLRLPPCPSRILPGRRPTGPVPHPQSRHTAIWPARPLWHPAGHTPAPPFLHRRKKKSSARARRLPQCRRWCNNPSQRRCHWHRQTGQWCPCPHWYIRFLPKNRRQSARCPPR